MLITLLTILAVLLTLSLGFVLGYKWRELHDKLELALKALATLTAKQKPEPPRPSNSVIDPMDLVQRAKWERDERMKRLNEE
jgi:hypothetical protein